jgi:hypothetical protein
MSTHVRALPALLVLVSVGLGGFGSPAAARRASNDLDAFMAAVLTRRDDNWRKLQQYVLDERETGQVLGPGQIRLYALEREYTWFIRDGIFVRSPVRLDGVGLSDAERRKAEQEWIDNQRAQEKARAATAAAAHQGTPIPQSAEGSTSVDAILRSTREPQFVSAAYFLRFKFEPGHYAFVGPEIYRGQQVLRIEYYPTRLYEEGDEHKDSKEPKDPKEPKDSEDSKHSKDSQDPKDAKRSKEDIDARLNRQMNKVSLVTLWVEPTAHQIVQYQFDNVGLDFLPARSLVRVNGFGSTMKMGQPFKDIWLPEGIDANGSVTLATGTYDVHYAVSYHDYRQADVQMRVK